MVKYKIYYILLSAFVILYGLYLIVRAQGLINFMDFLPLLMAMYFLNDIQLAFHNKKGDSNG